MTHTMTHLIQEFDAQRARKSQGRQVRSAHKGALRARAASDALRLAVAAGAAVCVLSALAGVAVMLGGL